MNVKESCTLPDEMLGVPYDRNAFYSGSQIESLPSEMNCETAVHYFYKRVLGITLPDTVRAAEILGGHPNFLDIDQQRFGMLGDILLLGSQKQSTQLAGYRPMYDELGELSNYIRTHMAVVINPKLDLYHSNKSGSAVWNLSDFIWRRQYKAIFKMVRYKDVIHSLTDFQA